MLTPDQLPLSQHLPLPPLDCDDVQPPDPVSWCSVSGCSDKGKASGTYLIDVLLLRFFLVLGNIRLKFARARTRVSKRCKHRHAFHCCNAPYSTADCKSVSCERDSLVRNGMNWTLTARPCV
jgi:hypothetical protein